MTNIIQFLHTTAAYQNAVLQLMVGEANFVAKQLDLKETVPVVAMAKTNEWEVEPPPDGIGGVVSSTNYTFYFHEGRLQSINKNNWLQKISPPVKDLVELAGRPS
ncbi:MAG: hypothetical protein M3Y82_13510, partial [Verrucomicrobiota bacterium]|nr:hypothetical protein [Verrucomicrobiota bacterium]